MVCFGTLRPLRSLREVCLRAVMSFLHADYAESAEFFIFFSVLRWRWRGRKLRYDERAQRRERLVFRFHHTPSPSGLPLSQGEKVGT